MCLPSRDRQVLFLGDGAGIAPPRSTALPLPSCEAATFTLLRISLCCSATLIGTLALLAQVFAGHRDLGLGLYWLAGRFVRAGPAAWGAPLVRPGSALRGGGCVRCMQRLDVVTRPTQAAVHPPGRTRVSLLTAFRSPIDEGYA